jgi:hypothetical protein
LPDQRLLNRYVKRLSPSAAPIDRLSQAIHHLHAVGRAGDPFFLSKSLELLVDYLNAAQATLVMASGDRVETRWWSPEREGEEPPPAVPSFCKWLLANPERTLVIRDMENSPYWASPADTQARFYKAALGCPIRQGEGVRSLLFVFFGSERAFPRTDFALLEAVAGLIGRVIEIEDLKQSMNRLEDALAITRAVVEDSSVRDPETGLPNLRYLDIWQKAMLGSNRRPESLVVAECQVAIRSRGDVARILQVAECVRAGDLVLRVAPGRFQIIFQHTPLGTAHILLLGMRARLDNAPMGATLWQPGTDGQNLESCRPRLEAALAESRAMAHPTLVWNLPEGVPEELSLQKSVETPVVSRYQRWVPPTIRNPRVI